MPVKLDIFSMTAFGAIVSARMREYELHQG